MYPAFQIRLDRRLTQKNWSNTILFSIFQKKVVTTTRCGFKFFLKNHVNHAFLFGFGQNKVQKWKKRLCFTFRSSYFRDLRSLWTSKYGFLHHFGCWSIDRYEEGLNLIYVSCVVNRFTSQMDPYPEKDYVRHILTCFYHLCALVCLKLTRNALYTPFLNNNCSKCLKNGIFWH